MFRFLSFWSILAFELDLWNEFRIVLSILSLMLFLNIMTNGIREALSALSTIFSLKNYFALKDLCCFKQNFDILLTVSLRTVSFCLSLIASMASSKFKKDLTLTIQFSLKTNWKIFMRLLSLNAALYFWNFLFCSLWS